MAEDVNLLAALETDVATDAPIGPTLRRCLLLGGRAGSEALRRWATQELNGYGNDDGLPAYRRVPSAILVDYQVGNQWAKGRTISPSAIPEYARELFAGGPTFYQGIGAIEAMAEQARASGQDVKITHAHAADLCAEIDKASGQGFMQQTHALYWSVSASSLINIVEQVRTQLAGMVAEMRASTPSGQSVPSAEVASEAVRKILPATARQSRN